MRVISEVLEHRQLSQTIRYIYELEIPNDGSLTDEELQKFRPKPLDGEVEAFEVCMTEYQIRSLC